MPFILETSDAMNLTEGSPVLYRGVEVGTVRKFELNSLGDRVGTYCDNTEVSTFGT